MGKEFDPGGWQSRRRKVQAGLVFGFAFLASASVCVGSNNQLAIDRDTELLRAAATDDGVILEQLASGMRDAGNKRSVIADIVVRNCVFNGARLTIAKDTPDIQEYLLAVGTNTVSTTGASDLAAQLPGLLSTCLR